MANPPARRGQQIYTSPDGDRKLSDFLCDDRNNELSHRDALEAARVEHDRVREAALRVYEMHELAREHQRILDDEKKETERLEAEARVAAEEKRLQELRAKSIPKPTPPPEPTPPPQKKPESATPPATASKVPSPAASVRNTESQPPGGGLFGRPPTASPAAQIKTEESKPAVAASTPFAAAGRGPSNSPFATAVQASSNSPFSQKPNGMTSTSSPAAPIKTEPTPQSQPPPAAPSQPAQPDRLIQIHKHLKQLRKDLMAQSKIPGSPLKGRLGDLRREIRVSIGQLTAGKGANTGPMNKINGALYSAITGKVPSQTIAMATYVQSPREPGSSAINNDDTLPSLFIYLLNICAKGIIAQFINECGANPRAAEPIGISAAQIFSNPDFHWRGSSLIDILLSKFRIVCPVLFGQRGNDKMERGRLALGWKREGASWITEQNHNDRMTGLGAGFAAVALRDFGKSSKINPYPPYHYWTALARILNTPAGETSNTQYVVVRAMIEHHESRFLNMYGSAAMAALKLALVDFPKKAPAGAPAAGSLMALAEVLRTEAGLVLT